MAKRKQSKKKTRRATRGKKSDVPPAGEALRIQEVPFHSTARRRYLNYALSVITSRALPDVRDGLKPVQRRILYTMQNDLHLAPPARHLKCARIVGDVLGKYHPHGDTAVYDALVRMAQDFSLRYPLVEGHGNFGSLDGDSAAAYRYTEARLQQLSTELLGELKQDTVDFRPNYDGKTSEPAVLPARIPNLLINGATGIAVGMATNIPPHNLAEVTEACEALIKNRELGVGDLVKYIKGPDFPTGGEILNSRREIRRVYEEGQGSIRLRGRYTIEAGSRATQRIVVNSIPYMVQKDQLVRAIGELIFQRKVPQLLDVRDESTDDVRIVLELKKDADPKLVMAYLYKHTALQTNFNVNLTCLVPGSQPGVSVPAKADLKTLLTHFIDFRYHVVERRFQHERRLLKERIHILEGFRKIFNALDEAIKLIRASSGREDAGQKLTKRFKLSEAQVTAILDMRLYKLARLEIKAVLDELREKKKRVKEIEAILASPRRLWSVVRNELKEARVKYGDGRCTRAGARGVQEESFDEEAFIVDEDSYLLLTRDGWVRRAGRIGDLSKVRMRPDDELIAVLGGNTRSTVVFFSNLGHAYTIRLADIPQSRGYGEPVQRFFKFRDGERVVGALSFDPRLLPDIGSPGDPQGKDPPHHGLAVSSAGYSVRFPLHSFAEPSTRMGRRYLRLKRGEEAVSFQLISGKETVVVASQQGRVILFPASEVNLLAGVGRGVRAIKLAANDRVLAAAATEQPKVGLRVYTTGGRKVDVTPNRYRVTSRGGKGVEVIKRGGLARYERPSLDVPDLGDEERGNGAGGSANGRTARSEATKRRRKK